MNKQWLLSLFLLFQTLILTAQISLDGRIGEKEMLTPKPSATPVINGPKIYGVRPGKKFVYRIPCQGERPMKFSVKGLPKGLKLNSRTGVITGVTPKIRGEYVMSLRSKNKYGKATRSYKLVVGDKIALTPPTGWNSWGGHMLFVSDSLLRHVADVFNERGFADAGYQYIGVDDCWMRISQDKYDSQNEGRRKNHAGYTYDEGVVGGDRDENGNIVPNDAFPDMKALTDYIHSYGLKAGLYSTPGPYTCQDFSGSFQHQQQDAEQYARWGFDLLKYDLCSGGIILKQIKNNNSLYQQKDFWKPMTTFLEQQDRDILLNLCQYGQDDPWTWAPSLGVATWRIGGDLNHHVDDYFKQALRMATDLRPFSKPGQWNDPDFMYIHRIRDHRAKGEPSHEIHLSTNQRYQYVTLWSIVAAPFFFSCDMWNIDDFTVNLLTNAQVLNINQDELGDVAKVIRNENGVVVLCKNLADGSKAVGVFNRKGEEVVAQVSWEELGLSPVQKLYDVWRHKEFGSVTQGMSVHLSAQGVGYYILSNDN